MFRPFVRVAQPMWLKLYPSQIVTNRRRNLFVDETCINCDTCRWMQGDTFVHEDGKSAVARQPETEVQQCSHGLH